MSRSKACENLSSTSTLSASGCKKAVSEAMNFGLSECAEVTSDSQPSTVGGTVISGHHNADIRHGCKGCLIECNHDVSGQLRTAPDRLRNTADVISCREGVELALRLACGVDGRRTRKVGGRE